MSTNLVFVIAVKSSKYKMLLLTTNVFLNISALATVKCSNYGDLAMGAGRRGQGGSFDPPWNVMLKQTHHKKNDFFCKRTKQDDHLAILIKLSSVKESE